MVRESIVLVQGDSVSATIRVVDKDREIVDISGGTVKFRIVEDIEDLKANSIYNNDAVTISDGPNGEALLTITRAITKVWTPGRYKWEVEYIDSGSSYSHTIFQPCTIVNSMYSEDPDPAASVVFPYEFTFILP